MYTIELIYDDNSSSNASVSCESYADLFMIARGWLICSSAQSVTIRNKDGFNIMSYKK